MDEQLIRERSPTAAVSSAARQLRAAALLSTGVACACLANGAHSATRFRQVSLSDVFMALFMFLAGTAAAAACVALRASAAGVDGRATRRASRIHAVCGLATCAAFAWSAETYLSAYTRLRSSDSARMALAMGMLHAAMAALALLLVLVAAVAAARHAAECRHVRAPTGVRTECALGRAGRNADLFFQACFGAAATALFAAVAAVAELARDEFTFPLLLYPAAMLVAGFFFLTTAASGTRMLVRGRPARMRIVLRIGVAVLLLAAAASIVADAHALHTDRRIRGRDGRAVAPASSVAGIALTAFAALVGTLALVRTSNGLFRAARFHPIRDIS